MNELLKQERAQSTTPTVSDGPTKVKVKWSGEYNLFKESSLFVSNDH
jgi:hypothetical protein